jgi:dolichol-phosphate mannosyltransferase
MVQRKLSVVSPVYGAEDCLAELVRRIIAAASGMAYDLEIILVEDQSPDRSWAVIEELSARDPRVRGFALSRNFGQHYAITAGLDQVTGDVVVVMDCDLQDRPEEIPRLVAKVEEGFDIALARRVVRRDSWLKKMGSRVFYQVLSYLSGSRQDAAVANFGAYSRQVVDEVRRLRESIRYFPTMVRWVGFRTAKVDVQHDAREQGTSGYDLRKLIKLATDIILAYSDKPLRIMVKVGAIIAVFAMCMAAYVAISWALGGITVLGYASLMVSIWFLSGMLMVTLGVVGLYVGKTFEGVKNRPLYIIARRT